MPGFPNPGVGLHLIKERKQFLGGFVSVRVRSPCAISCFFPFPHIMHNNCSLR